MNPAVCVPQNLGVMNVGEMVSMAGVAGVAVDKSAAARKLSISNQELLRNAAATLESLVLRVIETRTATEFYSVLAEVFPKYFEAALGLSLLARVTVPPHVMTRLSHEAFSEMEAEFREGALAAFGSAVRDQAIFTVWTIRKIADLSERIAKAPAVSKPQTAEDFEMFQKFAGHTMMTGLNLDCLLRSMRLGKPIYPEVLEAMINGLRSAVNAYAWVRRALDLRIPVTEQELAPVEWDDEDEALLREACADVITDPA